MLIQVKKGLDLPISGAPKQIIDKPVTASHVAILGVDYPGLKAEMLVKPGEHVKLGQTLFVDRRTRVKYVAPACGIIKDINRGPRRSLESVVIYNEGNEQISFPSYSRSQLTKLSPEDIRNTLLDSGLWTAFRTRPYNKNPNPDTEPHSLFITAMDTQPLAADPNIIIEAYKEDFLDGMGVLSRLFDVEIYVCSKQGAKLPVPDNQWIKQVQFKGPHPAGLVGTHIHYLDPVRRNKIVWHMSYQDVIAIGRVFKTGQIWSTRIIALGGPSVREPRLLPVNTGAALSDVISGELYEGKHRIISGSVLSGRHGDETLSYMGRYHLQVSVIEELRSGAATGYNEKLHRFSIHKQFPRWPMRDNQSFYFDSACNGRQAPFITLGSFERVMPLDILPTPLLRALLTGDNDSAERLGCLELDEEDLALCGFVCCSKIDYARPLRECLNTLETQGS